MPDDAELLLRYTATRDEDAFAELVRRHLDGVYAAALRRVGGDVHFAEDVAQQVFTALARRAAAASRNPYLSAWLYTTTRHEASNVVRRERRRKAREQHAHAMNETLDGHGSTPADWNRIAPLLDDAIDRLNDADRAAIVLRFVERRGFTEIGAVCDVSADAARMRVERALEKLRVQLSRRGLTSTAAALGIALSAHAVVPTPAAVAASVTSAALAGTTVVAGGAAATWVTFMSLTKMQTGAAFAAALAVSAALYETKRAQEMRAAELAGGQAVAVAAARVAALEGEARDVIDRVAQRERERELERMRAARNAVVTNAAPAPAAPSDSQLEALRQQIRARHTLERTNPDYQRLMRETSRRDLVRQFGPLYEELRLPRERVAEFERIMVEHDWKRTDAETAARLEGLSDSDAVLKKVLAGVEQQRDAALRELLGSEQHGRYEQFRYSESVRYEITDWMAAALYQTTTPLTRAQANVLTEILTRHTMADAENRADAHTIRWDAALNDARSALAPAQRPFLDSRRVQMAWRKAFNGAIGSLEEKPGEKKPNGG